jgi:NAD(P)-dependent dehydrogenase (short-subunit alcohol dehydrogenase family)
VVGCGPGMGGSAAVKFAREGFKIAAMCRRPGQMIRRFDALSGRALTALLWLPIDTPLRAESFAPTEAKFKELGITDYKFYATDATDKASVEAAFGQAAADLGAIDVLVYNVGGGGFGIPVSDTSYHPVRDVSYLPVSRCSRSILTSS